MLATQNTNADAQRANLPVAFMQAQTDASNKRFEKLVAPDRWAKLAPAIRKRFCKPIMAGESTVYQGQICETKMNLAGRVLAQTLRPFGAPLPLEPCTGGGAAIVTVTEAQNGVDQFWSRQYNRKRGFPQVIHSTKAFAGETGLEEGVGYGIGMTLRIEADGSHLRFVSERYFMTLFGKRIYLPAILMPGQLIVGHHDLGEGCFDFTLDLYHPFFGQLVHQRVTFHDAETRQ